MSQSQIMTKIVSTQPTATHRFNFLRDRIGMASSVTI
ncbi:putative Copia protein (Gag-int-pol protein) [Daphnia magna]|uniref:Putative Copia protein (Gag-int-pol protein) n=2 Tax=Daphnia magna TaxID=35525 RepID=A0A164IMC6_9CRUS|nr:putative Copia protein (Gag-int-pol protein) [Daphnia magna]